MRRARPFWTRRAFATVAAITTTSGAAWRWRITDGDGTALEESDEFFPTITALAARSSETPPPGTTPSSTAARVASPAFGETSNDRWCFASCGS
jgi:hypothetical protein